MDRWCIDDMHWYPIKIFILYQFHWILYHWIATFITPPLSSSVPKCDLYSIALGILDMMPRLLPSQSLPWNLPEPVCFYNSIKLSGGYLELELILMMKAEKFTSSLNSLCKWKNSKSKKKNQTTNLLISSIFSSSKKLESCPRSCFRWKSGKHKLVPLLP